MKTTKKILAVVLSVMLLLSVMPFAAFATDVSFTKVSSTDEITADNIGTCTAEEAKAWALANWDVVHDDDHTSRIAYYLNTGELCSAQVDAYMSESYVSDGFEYFIYQGAQISDIQAYFGSGDNVFICTPAAPAANYVAEVNGTGYETLEEAIAAANAGDTVTLLADIDFTVYPAFTRHTLDLTGVTLDLDGHTITGYNHSVVYVGDNFTIKNGNMVCVYDSVNNKKESYAAVIYPQVGNWQTDVVTDKSTGVVLENLVLTGGINCFGADVTVRGENTNVTGNYYYALWADVLATLTVEDGTFTSAASSTNGIIGACSDAGKEAYVYISGGDYTVPAGKNLVLQSTMASSQQLVEISGGTYNVVVPAKACAEGFVPVTEPDAQGKYTVAVDTAVAEVNGVKYDTFEEALAAISNVSTAKHSKAVDPTYDYKTYVANGTIKLLANTTSNGIIIGSGSNLVIDFNGKTLDINAKPVGSNGTESMALQLLKNSNITFKNGTLTSSYTYSDSDTEYILRLIQNYSNLTLDNMNVTMTGNFLDTLTISSCNGNFVVKDSTVNAPDFSAYGYTTETAAEQLGVKALAFGTFSGYTAATATVEGDSTINGNLSVGTTNPDVSTNTLSLTGGTINGDIIMSDNADSENVEITKANTFTQDAPEGYKWDDNGVLVKVVYVAEANGVKYESFEEALAAISNVSTAKHSKSADPTYDYKTYVANGTIKLLDDTTSNGIIIGSGSNLVVDFNGKTLDINAKPVGSNGTESMALQLLKNSNITFKNGTLTSSYTYSDSDTEYIQRLIQNYSNLTLDNMNVTMTGNFMNASTISTCNGDFVVKNSTVNAPDFSAYGYTTETAAEQLGSKALSFGTFSGYTAATATVEGNSTINGNISVGTTNPDVSTNTLALTGGTLTGDILMSDNADSENVEITKANTFTQDAPEGYKWVDNGDGTSTIEKIEATNGANLTLEGNIEEAIYLDADAYNLGDDAVIKVTANANSNISETPDVQTKTYAVSSLTPYTDPNGTYTGTYKFAVKNAPAQITETVTVALYASADAQEPIETIEYSVKEYCDDVIATSNDAKLVALCKSILDYGAAAQKEFNYNTDNMAVDTYYNADAIANLVYSDITGTLNYSTLPFTGIAFECLSTLNFNFYVTGKPDITEAGVVGDDSSAIKATLKQSTKTGKIFVNVSGIEAGNLHKSFVVYTSEGIIETNLNTLVKTCLYYGSSVELAKTIYFYSNAANAYFN